MSGVALAPLALLCGVLLTTQVGSNSTLARAVGNPYVAAAANMAVAVVLALALLIVSGPLPDRAALARAPWWAWSAGGALGVAYLSGNILLAPHLGAAALTGLIVAGQICWSVLLDHMGWLGFEQHAAGPWRLAGLGLMAVGVTLIARS